MKTDLIRGADPDVAMAATIRFLMDYPTQVVVVRQEKLGEKVYTISSIPVEDAGRITQGEIQAGEVVVVREAKELGCMTISTISDLEDIDFCGILCGR